MVDERTVNRTFREQKIGRNGLTVIDRDLPAFGLKVSKNGTRTFFVRVARKLGADDIVLGTADEITGLRWDWIRGTRAVLPDSKTGPKAILASSARAGRPEWAAA